MKENRRRQQVQQDLLRPRISLPQWHSAGIMPHELVALLMKLLEQHAKTSAVPEARGGSDE